MSRCLALALFGLLFAAGGCAGAAADVSADAHAAFPHQSHLSYFSSGRHRQEKIDLHLAAFGDPAVPEDLAEGKCTECHDDLAAMTACAGCHVAFQDGSLRGRKDVRKCVACHRGAWASTAATLPRPDLCSTCHNGAPPPGTAEYRQVRLDVGREYVGGVRGSVLPQNVYFSHRAHVRFAAMPCGTCHEESKGATIATPPVRAPTMMECLGCHVKNGASVDCLTCHK